MSTSEDSANAEIERLQKQIEHIQHENKVLNIRAQGLQVLGKVLQDSQDDNARLLQEVDQLKTQLTEKGIDPSQAQLSLLGLNSEDGSYSTMTEHTSRTCPSASHGTSGHDYVNVTTVYGPQSISTGFPSLLPGDFHIKEIQAEFQHIKTEVDHLISDTRELCKKIELSVGEDGDAELQVKLAQLSLRLKEYAKEAGARETLSSALVHEEEQIRDKLLAMEAEQASHENVAQRLKDKLSESKEELERIHDEVKFFEGAVLVNKGLDSPKNSERLSSLSASERSASGLSLEQPVFSKSPLPQMGTESCEHCPQLQRQLTELQRQLLEITREKDETLRLKEEILDVNHKWDMQYKMLQEATSKEITDLKQQVDVFKSRESQARIEQQANLGRNLQGHMPIPRAAALQPTSPSGAQNTPTWPVPPSNPQAMPPDVIDQIEVLKEQLRVYADDFATERNDRERVQAEKETMREELAAVKEQVQTLEQQLQIYEEDFRREQREKENLQQQMRALHLGGSYGNQDMAQRAKAVAEQQARVRAIKEVHEREKNRLLREQQELQQQVFAKQPLGQQYNRPSYPYPQAYGGALGYPPHGLGQQQWEGQNYPLTTRGPTYPLRQSIPTRGPIAYPADPRPANEAMFRGGEVLPDRGVDVVDSPCDVKDLEDATLAVAGAALLADEKELPIKECPRCLRRFDGANQGSLFKHIEKCIS